jgi:hypothetical protein
MENCPIIDENLLDQKISEINTLTNGDFKTTLNECPPDLHGAMYGGAITKKHIKYAIYMIYCILIAIGAYKSQELIIDGLNMILSGRCYNLLERFALFPNPICTYWRSLIEVVVSALRGDSVAISSLTLLTGAAVGLPMSFDRTVDGIASQIERVINGNTQTLEYDGDYTSQKRMRLKGGIRNMKGKKESRKNKTKSKKNYKKRKTNKNKK